MAIPGMDMALQAGMQAISKIMEQMNAEKGIGEKGGGQGSKGAGGGGQQDDMDPLKKLEMTLSAIDKKDGPDMASGMPKDNSSKIDTSTV